MNTYIYLKPLNVILNNRLVKYTGNSPNKGNTNIKCLNRVLGHHEPEQLQPWHRFYKYLELYWGDATTFHERFHYLVFCLVGRVAKKKPYLRLANKKIKMGKITQTLDRGNLPRWPAFRSRLFTVDVETGVLWVLFNEAAS